MNTNNQSDVSTDCLLWQAKVAHNHYEMEELLELTEDLSKRLKQLHDETWKKYVRTSF